MVVHPTSSSSSTMTAQSSSNNNSSSNAAWNNQGPRRPESRKARLDGSIRRNSSLPQALTPKQSPPNNHSWFNKVFPRPISNAPPQHFFAPKQHQLQQALSTLKTVRRPSLPLSLSKTQAISLMPPPRAPPPSIARWKSAGDLAAESRNSRPPPEKSMPNSLSSVGSLNRKVSWSAGTRGGPPGDSSMGVSSQQNQSWATPPQQMMPHHQHHDHQHQVMLQRAAAAASHPPVDPEMVQYRKAIDRIQAARLSVMLSPRPALQPPHEETTKPPLHETKPPPSSSTKNKPRKKHSAKHQEQQDSDESFEDAVDENDVENRRKRRETLRGGGSTKSSSASRSSSRTRSKRLALPETPKRTSGDQSVSISSRRKPSSFTKHNHHRSPDTVVDPAEGGEFSPDPMSKDRRSSKHSRSSSRPRLRQTLSNPDLLFMPDEPFTFPLASKPRRASSSRHLEVSSTKRKKGDAAVRKQQTNESERNKPREKRRNSKSSRRSVFVEDSSPTSNLFLFRRKLTGGKLIAQTTVSAKPDDLMSAIIRRLQESDDHDSLGLEQSASVLTFTDKEASSIKKGELLVKFSLRHVKGAMFGRDEFGRMHADELLSLTRTRPMVVDIVTEKSASGEKINLY